MMTAVWTYLVDRRRSLIAWAVGVIALVLVMAAFYPSIRETGADFDAYVDSLPESVRQTLGISGSSIASPEGYLMSQLYSNLYPMLLLILGISMGSWAIAGAEGDGTLEMTLAAPIKRASLAWGRLVAVAVATLAITALSTLALALISPPLDLLAGLPWWGVWSAAISMWALVPRLSPSAQPRDGGPGRSPVLPRSSSSVSSVSSSPRSPSRWNTSDQPLPGTGSWARRLSLQGPRSCPSDSPSGSPSPSRLRGSGDLIVATLACNPT